MIFVTIVTLAQTQIYTLAVEWPPTVCLTKACNYLQNWSARSFNLHGLWPQNATNCRAIELCSSQPFSDSTFSGQLKSDLSAFWVGVFSSATDFHSHEWTKHGTCYEKLTSSTIAGYFSKAIELAKSYNPVQKLAVAGIVPDFAPNNVASMERAIGLSGAYACQEIAGKQYISALYLCLNQKFQNTACKCQPTVSSGQIVCRSTQPVYYTPLKK